MGGVIVLLLFLLFLWEWPRLINELEAATCNTPDPLVAAIRRARVKAGLTPWSDNEESDDDKYL